MAHLKFPIQFVTQAEIDDLENCNLLRVFTPGWYPGWYFWDDTQTELHGPYLTSQLALAAWDRYRGQMDGLVDPPEDDRKIIIEVKGATDTRGLFEGLYTKETNSVYVACVSKAFGDYAWDQINRWWPFPSAKDLDFLAEHKRQAEGV